MQVCLSSKILKEGLVIEAQVSGVHGDTPESMFIRVFPSGAAMRPSLCTIIS